MERGHRRMSRTQRASNDAGDPNPATVPPSLLQVYSLAGGLFLLRAGQFFFFIYPEWSVGVQVLQLRRLITRAWCSTFVFRFIYGGIGVGVCALACIQMITLSNVRWPCPRPISVALTAGVAFAHLEQSLSFLVAVGHRHMWYK